MERVVNTFERDRFAALPVTGAEVEESLASASRVAERAR